MKNTNHLKFKFDVGQLTTLIVLTSICCLLLNSCLQEVSKHKMDMTIIKIERYDKYVTKSALGDTINKYTVHYYYIKNYKPSAENLNWILKKSFKLRDEIESNYSKYGHIASIIFYSDSTNFSPYFKDEHKSWLEFDNDHLILKVGFAKTGFENIVFGEGLLKTYFK